MTRNKNIESFKKMIEVTTGSNDLMIPIYLEEIEKRYNEGKISQEEHDKLIRYVNKRKRLLEYVGKYVIVRKFLVDPEKGFDFYCYYPRKKDGAPPYLFDTKEEADKKLPDVIERFRCFGDSEKTIKVAEFEPHMYLNRF